VEVDEAVGAVREIADFAHDEDLGQAIIDRVLERGLLRLDGPSVRTLHVNLDKEDSDQQADLVRISGTQLEPDGRLAQSWRGASEVRSPGLRPQA